MTILITGGTGFLGRNLAVSLKDRYTVILGARNNKQMLEAGKATGCVVVPLDVTSIESVRDVVNEFRPHIIIHAAATKYVDLSEKYPMECVDINVLGSQNVARVALDKNVEVVVGISTDKAAPPVRNMYGMSKAVMEKIFCGLDSKTSTQFVCVRYGNVAWSTGSVLPVWKERHAQTNTITVTDPDMRRFFFTVEDAVTLIETAITHIGELHGRVLSRAMKVARLGDIATAWVQAKGGSVEYTGQRPGERVDEFLIGDLELPYTETKKYNDIDHFIITFNQPAVEPVLACYSTANAIPMTAVDISDLIANQPPVR